MRDHEADAEEIVAVLDVLCRHGEDKLREIVLKECRREPALWRRQLEVLRWTSDRSVRPTAVELARRMATIIEGCLPAMH